VNEWVADWDDVLRRARHSRYRSRRTAAIAGVVAAAAAVVLLMPGIGVGGGLNAWVSTARPGLQLRTTLTLPGGGRAGTLSIRTSRIFFTTPRHAAFVRKGLAPVPIDWSLDLAAGKSAASAVVQDRGGKVIARLCAPCADNARGTVKLRPRTVLEMLGQATVVVETNAGTARGVLRLPIPVR
jgi:hypothetical protein